MTRFGTDGIRGHFGQAPVTVEQFQQLGHQVAQFLIQHHQIERPKVVIGADTRLSSPALVEALKRGLLTAPLQVHDMGILPTPAVAQLTVALKADFGLMVTASHNPYSDNGVKFFSPDGAKLSPNDEKALGVFFKQVAADATVEAISQQATSHQVPEAISCYVSHCQSQIARQKPLAGLSILVDCAHGAASPVARVLFEALGAQCTLISDQPNGININEQCGVLYPDVLIAAMKKHDVDLGVAFDGDADRLLLVDRQGQIYNGDDIIYILANAYQQAGQWDGGVVGTVMSNMGLAKAFEEKNIPFERVDVGDKYVVRALKEKQWLLGGESSGHVIWLPFGQTGDGLMTTVAVMMAMRDQQSTLAELCDYTRAHQCMKNFKIQAMTHVPACVDYLTHYQKQHLSSFDGRILIRPSGTEPVLRILAESHSQPEAEQCATRLYQAVSQWVDHHLMAAS